MRFGIKSILATGGESSGLDFHLFTGYTPQYNGHLEMPAGPSGLGLPALDGAFAEMHVPGQSMIDSD
jgi:hypothetical protein